MMLDSQPETRLLERERPREVAGLIGLASHSSAPSVRIASRAVRGRENAEPMSVSVSERARTFISGATAGMWASGA